MAQRWMSQPQLVLDRLQQPLTKKKKKPRVQAQRRLLHHRLRLD
jgi:hypothetical protein